MKSCIVVIFLCFGAINLLAQPNDSAAQNQNNATAQTHASSPAKNSEVAAHDTETAKSGTPSWYTSSEWWLVIIAALTGAAIVYQAREMTRTTKVIERSTEATEKTVGLLEKQANLMEKQLSIPYRAYLSVGHEVWLNEAIEAQIPIENIGQVAGNIISIDIELIIQRKIGDKQPEEIYRKSIKQTANKSVVRGKDSAFNLLIYFPKKADAADTFIIGGTVEYDTGFNSMDTLNFARVYEGRIAKWKTGWGYTDFVFDPPEEQGKEQPK